MRDLNDILSFAAVVEHRGFTAAARALNQPKSSVSRHVARLESRLGARLLERSTRVVRLTDIGRAYYDRCRVTLAELEDAEQDVAQYRSSPVGIVRVSCPTGFAQHILAHILPDFMKQYPLVRIQVVVANRAMDLLEDRVDVAIRARPRLEDESVTIRKLGSSPFIAVASAAFAANHPRVTEPEHIVGLPFLSFQEETQRPRWTMIGPSGVTQTVSLEPVLWTGDFNILLAAAEAGCGIAFAPMDVVPRLMNEHRLVQMLPGWRSEDMTVHLAFLAGRGMAPAIRVFIDYMAAHFPAARALMDRSPSG